ncbi:hypothetical protein, partial [Paenochrobactrum glaciei]|uniref:hypothetical protein n=1 Tax=Paenochrobactrum glaciei TaxID=486407 RepID=UPI0031D7AD0B
ASCSLIIPIICSSENRERFIVHLLPRIELYQNLEEFAGLTSIPIICSSENRERFIVHLLPRIELYQNLEEFAGLTSGSLVEDIRNALDAISPTETPVKDSVPDNNILILKESSR